MVDTRAARELDEQRRSVLDAEEARWGARKPLPTPVRTTIS